MTEFVALRPKLYAYKNLDGKVGKRGKGTKICVVKKTITFEDYVHWLHSGKDVYRTQLLFRTLLHRVYTQQIHKVALSSKDNKRFTSTDTIRTIVLGTIYTMHESLCKGHGALLNMRRALLKGK